MKGGRLYKMAKDYGMVATAFDTLSFVEDFGNPCVCCTFWLALVLLLLFSKLRVHRAHKKYNFYRKSTRI